MIGRKFFERIFLVGIFLAKKFGRICFGCKFSEIIFMRKHFVRKCFDRKLELPIGTSDMAVKELDCVGPDPFVVCCGVPISISSRFLDGW